MSAVLFRLRTDARATLRAFATLALLLGLAGGVVFASWAGARRTDGAYPAFLRHAHAADIEVGVEQLNGAEAPFLDAVERLPQVAAHARRAYVFVTPTKPNGDPDPTSKLFGQTLTAADDAMWKRVDAETIVAGRHSDPNNPNEITVGRALATHFGVHVGQVINAASWSPAAAYQVLQGGDFVAPDGPRIAFRVVGVEISPGELAAASFDNTPVHLTPAFFHKYQDAIGTSQGTRIVLRHGLADVAAFRAGADRLALGQGRLNVTDQQGLTAKVERSVHLQAISLRLFAGLAGLAAVVIIGQAIIRQLLLSTDESTILRGIGMTRRQLAALALLRAGGVAVVGAALAVLIAVAASPLTPVGLARVVDPNPGVHVDALTFGGGALLLVAVVMLIALWPALLGARAAGAPAAVGETRGSRLAEALARAGMPPWTVTGTRFALEPGAGRTSVPVRSTIAGAVLAVAALAGAASFASSLTHLLDTPRLYGWNFDAVVGNPYAFNIRDAIVPGLRKDPAIAEFSSVATAAVTVNGRSLTALGFAHVRGNIDAALESGRAPVRPDEVTLGAKTLRALHRHVGETVSVASDGGKREMHIVGTAVYPSVGVDDPGGVGEGAGLTMEGLHAVAPDAPQNIFPFTVRPGVDVRATAARLRKQYAIGQVNVLLPSRPTDIDNYEAVRFVPIGLAALLGFVAMGTLANTLVSSVRRRRRDIALLKTLGFLRRQIRAAVAWQATVLAAIALVVGVPIGVALGRWAWRVYALQQGVVPEPAVPALALLLLLPVMLVIANLIAFVPAASAARTRPAVILRAAE